MWVLLMKTLGAAASLLYVSLALGQAQPDTDDPVAFETATRALILRCELDPDNQDYLLRLSDRFLKAYRRSHPSMSDEEFAALLARGKTTDISSVSCNRTALRDALQERDEATTDILGEPAPVAPQPVKDAAEPQPSSSPATDVPSASTVP